jgi:hypothetical protein
MNQLYGFRPKKEGQAYEMLLAAAFKLLEPGKEVGHDDFVRGVHSGTIYQVDALRNDGAERTMGEAKDYTARMSKVGRGDVQKLAGALPDLKVQSGILASATGFTKPAVKYAANAKDIVGSGISLWDVRPVIESDMDGRLQTIVLRMHVMTFDYPNSKFDLIYTHAGKLSLKDMLDKGLIGESIQMEIDNIFNADGSVLITLADLTRGGFGSCDDKVHHGSFLLGGGHVYVRDRLIPIKAITYKVPVIEVEMREIKIRGDGVATLLVKSIDGSVDKVIRDADLKRVLFEADGKVEIKPKGAK